MPKLRKIDMNLEKVKLANGFTIYVLENKNCSKHSASLFTRFGSEITNFEVGGKNYKIPFGTAHFLEHKMFEQADGIDPFTFFSKNGSYANAYTNKKITNYLFEGSTNFRENLLYLLDFVASPYFTDENVEKEKGIIQQELSRVNDSIFKFQYNILNKNAFNTLGLKIPVIGTEKSINSITKEDLYNCYNNFYAPNNMTLFVSGNVTKDEVLSIVADSKYYKMDATDFSFSQEAEDVSIAKSIETLKRDIATPKVSVGFKIPIENMDPERLFSYIHFTCTLFKDINEEVNELFENGFIDAKDLGTIVYNQNKFICLGVGSATKYPDKIVDFIKEKAKNVLTEEEFELEMKAMLSSYLYVTDHVDRFHNVILHKIIEESAYLDEYDLFEDLNYKEYLEYMKSIDFNNNTTLIIDCKKN